jgi:MFS family permease
MRHRMFRMLWLGGLVSNIGAFMHAAGAAWVMTDLTRTASMVSLLQTAMALPTFALAMFAGALADVLDRRRLLITVLSLLSVIAASLGLTTLAGMVTPGALLAFTLALGVGNALSQPAWISVSADLVPREELAAASALNSLSVNAAQAAGPAVCGVLIAVAGPGWVFLCNAAGCLVAIAAVRAWCQIQRGGALPPEHLFAAMRTGLRYVGNSPSLLVLYFRLGVAVFCTSCMPALLPLVARQRLGLAPAEFGLLFGAIGLGALVMATRMTWLRARTGPDTIAFLSTMAYAVAFAMIAAAPSLLVVAAALMLSGAGMISIFSTLTATVQAVLPAWVRGRGLAVFWLVLQGSLAGGALLWGALADVVHLTGALFAASAATAIVALAVMPLRLAGRADIDIRTIECWQPMAPIVSFDREQGPVLVLVEWQVEPENVGRLAAAMSDIRLQRRRTGALTWHAYQDVNMPGRILETYTCASWAEHELQHHRTTVQDRMLEQRVAALLSKPSHTATHLISLKTTGKTVSTGATVVDDSHLTGAADHPATDPAVPARRKPEEPQ